MLRGIVYFTEAPDAFLGQIAECFVTCVYGPNERVISQVGRRRERDRKRETERERESKRVRESERARERACIVTHVRDHS